MGTKRKGPSPRLPGRKWSGFLGELQFEPSFSGRVGKKIVIRVALQRRAHITCGVFGSYTQLTVGLFYVAPSPSAVEDGPKRTRLGPGDQYSYCCGTGEMGGLNLPILIAREERG